MRKTFLFLLLAMLCMAQGAEAKKKLHTIGDSTMANYATDGSTDKRGWCQMLQQFFNTDNLTVNNRGKSGASSKSFYKESAYWPTMVKGGSDAMQSGDFLIIQFAHNDEKNGGADGDVVKAYYTSKGDAATAASTDYRGTTASGTFKEYLRKYIDEAKAMGVKPIVVGAICRKYFSGNDIRRNGRHDLGDSFTLCDGTTYSTGNKVPASDDTYDYVVQAKNVAYEYDDVPFIDLTTLTADLYIRYGEAYCTSALFCKDDSTHPCGLGATLIARAFAQQLKSQAESETDAKRRAILAELAQDVVVSNDISFNPTSGNLGESYIGMNLTKEFNVSAFGLTPDAGTFTFTTSEGFSVSTDKATWSNNAQVAYSGASLIATIYVRVKISAAGTMKGTLTASDGTHSKTLDLTASGISLAGGTEASCVWLLNGGGVSATSELLTGLDVTASGMTLQGSTVTPTDGTTTGKMAYWNIEGGTWPAGEIDEVSTRYIQFQAIVPAGKEFNLDKISMNLCGWGGNSVCYHAYYATQADFSDQVLIGEALKMTNKNAVAINADVVKKLEEGQSVYIRVYPWLSTSSAATGKYIALSDVTIHGMLSDAGAQTITIDDAAVDLPFVGGKTDDYTFSKPEMEMGMTPPVVAFGKNVQYSKTRTMGDYVANLVQNISGASLASSASDDNAILVTLRPTDGFTFIPSAVSFGASRVGTSGGSLTVDATVDGKTVTLKESWAPGSYQTAPYYNDFNEPVDGLAATVDKPLVLRISLLGLGANKEIAFHDIKVTGTLSGTLSTATRYPLTVKVTPEGAGTVTVTPQMEDYKEGSTVTLQATKNFGYRFVEWQDAEGQSLATTATTTITMDAAKTVVASFEAVPVYTVTTQCHNDADRSLGAVTLTPDEHAGKYEAGTEITAVAEESKIAKFMQWTDSHPNATAGSSRKLTVEGNMTLVAQYEIQDFIAVFNASMVNSYAYETTGNYPFPADMAWDEQRNATAQVVRLSDGQKVWTKDGGTPVVRNREGVVLTGINGLYQNGFDTRQIAFQYQFSTKAFTAATFTGDMAAKNMAAKNWKVQASTDGKNFADLNTEGSKWVMTANAIQSLSIALPQELMGQDLVTLRFVADGEELLSSSYQVEGKWMDVDYYAHSESGIGNVYVLGEAEVAADEVAPQLTGTIPANGAEGVSAMGTITLSYDERITAGNASLKATLNGQELTPTWNSRSVSFMYNGLEYGKTYTLAVPAGYVADKSGNLAAAAEVTFTVMERQKPQARSFNAIVDGSLAEDKVAATDGMPAQYKTIQAAINDAPSQNELPYLIYIKEGYYKDANTTFKDSYGQIKKNASDATATQISGGVSEYDSCYIVNVNKPNIHLIGQDVNKVTIASDRLDGMLGDGTQRPWYHINAGATLEVQAGGKDFYMENVTLDNENWTKLALAGPQALAANVSADRAAFNNCNIRSYQDTYYNGGDQNRTFINNCVIEGAVDFIYGSSDVWFEGCTLNINRDKGGYIVAPNHPESVRWGYVFSNTKITTTYASDPSKWQIYLGRPWHNQPQTVFLHTQMELTPYDGYWYPTMGGLPKLWAVYDIWDRNGNKLSDKSIDTYYYTDASGYHEGKAKNSLTAEEVARYTVANVMAGDGSNNADKGRWNPMPLVEKTAKPQLEQHDGVVTWEADPYAICYVVTVDGKAVAFPTACSYNAQKGQKVSVQSVNEYGALSEPSAVITIDATGIEAIEADVLPAGMPMYNLMGMPVSRARGIVFVGGQKMMVR